MKFIHRLSYYLTGFGVGIILLLFFLGGKKTSCDWGLDARVLKNIRLKERVVNQEALSYFENKKIDTSAISKILQTGDVDFKKSDIEAKPCKIYHIEGEYKSKKLGMIFENCDSIVRLKKVFDLE
ncbi:DUF4258 domain-containing protein [Psychroflexus aestuariivivens]|uniref:DUF4258 domain-containing protein n=1 Tax=Psychroflexus aestuariivivens TaxID=1795040 RepID=UPI000FDCCA44|nr:DUF4258 domain-containing protein [Psychroflexus aestuariivivens]